MEQALIVVAVMVVLVVAATGTVAVLAVRGARRRYRAVRARLRVLGPPTPPGTRTVRAPASAALATLASPGWWSVQHRRQRMWRAVSSAEQAVAIARRAEVAVGDLPALVGRLSAAARGADAVLRAGARRGSLRPEDRTECDRIEAAAVEIHDAAMSSLRSASRADTDPVLSAVRIEVAALAAGVRASFR